MPAFRRIRRIKRSYDRGLVVGRWSPVAVVEVVNVEQEIGLFYSVVSEKRCKLCFCNPQHQLSTGEHRALGRSGNDEAALCARYNSAQFVRRRRRRRRCCPRRRSSQHEFQRGKK